MKQRLAPLTTNETANQFARVFGAALCVDSPKHIRCKTQDRLGLFTKAFGPPETWKDRDETIIFWNFARDGRRSGFSLFARTPETHKPKASIDQLEVEVFLVAETAPRSFKEWTALRLAVV